MSILARFTPTGMTSDRYEEVNRRLPDGVWPPDGLQLHVCFGEEGDLRVSEVWDSEEKMRAFGEHLMPVLQEVGIKQAGPPQILPVVRFEAP